MCRADLGRISARDDDLLAACTLHFAWYWLIWVWGKLIVQQDMFGYFFDIPLSSDVEMNMIAFNFPFR